MAVRKLILTLLIFIFVTGGILTGCDTATTEPGTKTVSAAWSQKIVQKIKDMQPLNIPGNLTQDTSYKTGDEFNVNDYFPVLTHLSMESGYVLDYVYYCSDEAGSPILYARQKKQMPFEDFDMLTIASNMVVRPENDSTMIWLTAENNIAVFGNKIKIDNTNEGYFEYTVLQILGNQFYQFWHANYNDTRIVCVKSEVEDIIADIDASGLQPIDKAFKDKALKLDLQPTLEFTDDLVTVKVVTFSKWGGFTRVGFTMYRNSPHSIIGYESEELLNYESGLAF